MANKVTIHFRDERVERATYIAETVGFGEVIRTVETYRSDGLYCVFQITSTGVIIVRGISNALVTMYIAKPEQIVNLYKNNNWGRVPMALYNKAKKNWQKGYIKNQPDFR